MDVRKKVKREVCFDVLARFVYAALYQVVAPVEGPQHMQQKREGESVENKNANRSMTGWFLMVCVIVMGMILMACLGGDEEIEEISGPDHACFVHCQSSFGVSSACFSSGADYRSESSCTTKANDYCGNSAVNRSGLVVECNCSASCEPDWYSK